MLTIENNFNTNLIKNFIELLYKIPNIKEEIFSKSLKILNKINKNVGIIDESEKLFWNNLDNQKLFDTSIEGLYFLIQNCYGCDTEDKISKLINLFNEKYLKSKKDIQNYLCNIIKNISINKDYNAKIFACIMDIIDKIDFNDDNFKILSQILLNIINSSSFDKILIMEKINVFENLIKDNKINSNIINIINSLEKKTNNKIINDFIKFNKNIINGTDIDYITNYLKLNNPKSENIEYLLPYIEKNLNKNNFIKLLYSIGNNNRQIYSNLNISNLADNMIYDIENIINIINDGILFLNKFDIERIIIPKVEKIKFYLNKKKIIL